MSGVLPTDAKARKDTPIFSGVLRYFPRALAYVAEISKAGNDQHNPGQPLHWSKHKSTDHGDCIVRHQVDAGTLDTDGKRHSGKVAWRALAQLEMELEAAELGISPEALIAQYQAVAAKSDPAPVPCKHDNIRTRTDGWYCVACDALVHPRKRRASRA